MMHTPSLQRLKGLFIDSIELPDPDFSTADDKQFAFFSLIAFGLYIWLRETLVVLDAPLHETIVNMVFELAFFIPVILINVSPVERWLKTSMVKDRGLSIASIIIISSSVYYAIASIAGFQTIQSNLADLEALFFPGLPWFAGLLILFGFILLVFHFSVLLMEHRCEKDFLRRFWGAKREHRKLWILFLLLLAASPLIGGIFLAGRYCLMAPILITTLFALSQARFLKYAPRGFALSDLFSLSFLGIIVLLGQYIKFVQPQVPLALILIVLFQGGKTHAIGRAHFHYKYTAKRYDLAGLMSFMLLSLLVMFLISILTGFIALDNFRLTDVTALELFNNIVAGTYYVGIAEEIVFRVLLVILLSDLFTFLAQEKKNAGRGLNPLLRHPRFFALVLSSLLFGLVHAAKGWDYALVAAIAGFAYGFAYLRHQNLFGPILLHMTADVIGVTFFQANL